MFILLVLLNPFLLDPIFDDPESETTLQHLESSISDAKIPQKINNIFSFEQQKFALSDEATDVMRNHFMGRLIAGANLKFTGPKREKRVVKINKGGDRCVVCYLDLCGRRNPDLIELIRRQLEWTGFNGHFYYRIGGFPAPHHYELKYAATPYSFKIFLMEEAHLLGFSKVLWIDSRMIPIRSIEPLFDKLKRKRCFFLKGSRMCHPNFLSLAIENLNKTLHIHPLNYTGIATGVFGLDFAYPPTRQFIQDYYTCAENGFCFLSVFPEESVVASILAKYPSKFSFINNKNIWTFDNVEHEPKLLKKAKNLGYYFFGVGDKSQHTLHLLAL